MFTMAHQRPGLILKTLLENPELLNPPKTDDNGCKKSLESPPIYNSQSAFLGPDIWANNSSQGDEDFNFEYMDLEEFLAESGITANGELFGDVSPSGSPRQDRNGNIPTSNVSTTVVGPSTPLTVCESPPCTTSQPVTPCTLTASLTPAHPGIPSTTHDLTHNVDPAANRHESVLAVSTDLSPLQHPPVLRRDSTASVKSVVPVDVSFKEHDLALANVPGQDDFDPRRRAFSEDELRPQPMIKKSTKLFVPDGQKDDKYWFRRKKNNVAAKRSRDARRIKENQITLRAAFLEKQNDSLQDQLAAALEENQTLRENLAKYETASP